MDETKSDDGQLPIRETTTQPTTTMNKLLLTSTFVIGLAAGQMANAINISGSVGGAPTGAKHLNFDDLLPYVGNPNPGTVATTGPDGPISISLNPNALVVKGSVSGQYAAPWLSGLNGQGFNSQVVVDPVNGEADTTPYLTSGRDGYGDTGKITLAFTNPQQYFGLLWGSIDDYNTMKFYSGGTLVDVVTGSQATASPNGNQGVNGTLYLNINTSSPFDTVEITSQQFAFEFDNVAYNDTPLYVPDGGTTAALLGLGLTGLGFLARRKV